LVGASLVRSLTGDRDFDVVPISRGNVIPPGKSPSIVVHAAWPSNDAASWAPFREWSLSLRESAADRGARFVALGSGVELFADHPGLKEPYKTYAQRKVELRKALRQRDAKALTWLRLHFMFGPDEPPSRIIPAAIRAALAGDEFTCGSLDRRRRWLHVDDQADYLRQFLKSPRDGDWDIAGCHDVSFRDLLAMVGRVTGRKLQVKESHAPVPDADVFVIAPERMASVVPADAGEPATLLQRLKEYSAHLIGASTQFESRVM
jgi:nucleoside-diphosphate-sugar epimerase